jgi:hypothetical protein
MTGFAGKAGDRRAADVLHRHCEVAEHRQGTPPQSVELGRPPQIVGTHDQLLSAHGFDVTLARSAEVLPAPARASRSTAAFAW